MAKWVKAYYAMTFSTNISATCKYSCFDECWRVFLNISSTVPVLLTWRIWYMDQKAAGLRRHQKSPLRPLLHITIDAGLIYSLTVLVGWICLLAQSNAHFTVQDMVHLARSFIRVAILKIFLDWQMVPIISIAFYTVIICIGLVYRTDNPTDGAPLRNIVTPARK